MLAGSALKQRRKEHAPINRLRGVARNLALAARVVLVEVALADQVAEVPVVLVDFLTIPNFDSGS